MNSNIIPINTEILEIYTVKQSVRWAASHTTQYIDYIAGVRRRCFEPRDSRSVRLNATCRIHAVNAAAARAISCACILNQKHLSAGWADIVVRPKQKLYRNIVGKRYCRS